MLLIRRISFPPDPKLLSIQLSFQWCQTSDILPFIRMSNSLNRQCAASILSYMSYSIVQCHAGKSGKRVQTAPMISFHHLTWSAPHISQFSNVTSLAIHFSDSRHMVSHLECSIMQFRIVSPSRLIFIDCCVCVIPSVEWINCPNGAYYPASSNRHRLPMLRDGFQFSTMPHSIMMCLSDDVGRCVAALKRAYCNIEKVTLHRGFS